MNRPHFLFRPNMQNEDHKRAWRLLQEVPEGQKSAFIVRAILQMDQEDRLETMLRRVIREEKKYCGWTARCRTGNRAAGWYDGLS